MDNQYTVIRYHIYRELAKYREMQEERDSAVINDFAIPVLSGIVVGIVIKAYTHTLIARIQSFHTGLPTQSFYTQAIQQVFHLCGHRTKSVFKLILHLLNFIILRQAGQLMIKLHT